MHNRSLHSIKTFPNHSLFGINMKSKKKNIWKKSNSVSFLQFQQLETNSTSITSEVLHAYSLFRRNQVFDLKKLKFERAQGLSNIKFWVFQEVKSYRDFLFSSFSKYIDHKYETPGFWALKSFLLISLRRVEIT